MYMPNDNCQLTLVGENEEEYVVKYISSCSALSGGLRGFSIAHGLVERDTVIFHLVEAAKFKTSEESKLADLQPPRKDLENCSAEDSLEVLEGINGIKFEDIITDQSKFTVIVNGLNIDSQLPDDTRLKYCKFYCSENGFLHNKLIEGMNRKLVAGMISGTVDIADAIEVSKFRLSIHEFDSINAHLGAFELMGMEVAFLREQLQQAVVGTTKESKVMEKHLELMTIETKHFHEEDMDDDFMKTWMY
ncbi:hypothetical protein Sjap_017230 [Stephania japonica]|uniref:Uncharacterized protein n=1 Tax=Stephania japonica TaxID=461633 RepID=A0AAP0I5V4_9MAGN